jgi:hypothetical protein
MIVDVVGLLECPFEVYTSEKMRANVLSITEVDDLYKILEVHGEAFIVRMPGGDLE